jgi:hypothetical protein
MPQQNNILLALMNMMQLRQLILALTAIACVSGCSITDASFQGPVSSTPRKPESPGVIPTAYRASSTDDKELEDIYAALYPYYAELCALSEIKKKPGFGAEINGGFGGHSVLYLNGVCRDHDVNYPTIRLCEAGTDAVQGVGLSVNDHFKNTNWVATEGRSFLFYGSLKPGDEVNRAGYLRTQAAAERMGVLDGVKFHRRFFEKMPVGVSEREYMYEISIATDYAVNFGRDRYCGRVPMNREQMKRVVAYLNQLNAPYRDGKQVFHWNVLGNNCSHMTHNALAAAGIWDTVDVDKPFFISAFDFPVPKNEFVNLMRRTNDMPLDNLLRLYRDDAARQSFMTHGQLPPRAGALADVVAIMPDNKLYDTDTKLIFYDPIGIYQREFQRILTDARYLDLQTNLRYFAALFQRIKAERKPLAWYYQSDRKFSLASDDTFATFYKLYYQLIDQQSTAIDANLASLNDIISHSQSIISSSASTQPLLRVQ